VTPAHLCAIVIASAAKQSILPSKGRKDCFAASLFAMTGDSLIAYLPKEQQK